LEERFFGFYLRGKMNLKEMIMDKKVPKFKMTNSVFDLSNIAKNTNSTDPAVRRVAQIEFKKFIIYCVIVGALLILLGIF